MIPEVGREATRRERGDHDTSAAAQAAELRAGGAAAKALAVVRAALAGSLEAQDTEATKRLRLEGMLAAFSLGDDAAVAEMAEGAADAVGQVLLSATRGEPVEPAPGRGLVASLHHGASAVGAARRGQIDEARAHARKIRPADREALAASDLLQAITLAGGSAKASQAVRSLRRSSLLMGDHELIAEELSLSNASLAQQETSVSDATAARIAARAEAADAIGAALHLARTEGPTAFAPEHRATALLYQGFAWVGSDPVKAERCFDAAIAAGCDLGEAYRGKLLATQQPRLCGHCDELHPADPADAARAADRLAKTLAKQGASALCAQASLFAARAWTRCLEPARTLASLARAREAGLDEEDALEVTCLEAIVAPDLDAAEATVEALLARHPSDALVHRTHIELARMRGDRELVRKRIIAGADAGVASLAEDARLLRRPDDWGPAGAMAGAKSAGAIAAALDVLVRSAPEAEVVAVLEKALDDADDRLSALESADHGAVLGATLIIVDWVADASERLVERCLAPFARARRDLAVLERNAAIAAWIDGGEAVEGLLAGLGDDVAAAVAVVSGVSAVDSEWALRWLASHAARLPRRELGALSAAAASVPSSFLPRAIEETSRRLEPELDLEAIATGDFMSPEEAVENILALPETPLDVILDQLRIRDRFEALPPATRAELEREGLLVGRRDDENQLHQFFAKVTRTLGLELSGSGQQRAAKDKKVDKAARKRQRNARKQQRRKKKR